MHSILRRTDLERYAFIQLRGIPGDAWVDVGETRDYSVGTLRPILGSRTLQPKHFQMDPFASYGDRDILTLQLVDSGNYLLNMLTPDPTALDGDVLTVCGIGLSLDVPVYDGPDFYWELFRAEVISVVLISAGMYVLTAEIVPTPEDYELDLSAAAPGMVIGLDGSGDHLKFLGTGGGVGDMTKAVYDANNDGIVAAADYAAAAGNADTVDGQHAAAFEAAGAAAAAVGTHEGTYAHGNIPSAGEKAALPGTSGVPSVTNKYVTNADARNSDARTPTAHAGTHSTGQPDALAPANIGAAAAAHTHGGGDITSAVANATDAATAAAAPWTGITGKPAVLGGDLVFRLATSQIVTHDMGVTLAHGATLVDAGAYVSGTWTFRMVGWTAGPTSPITARARLYNLTDREYVTGADVTTTALVATEVASAALTVGSGAGNLQNSKKTYEVRMEVTGGVWNTDTAHFGSVELVRT